MMTKRDMIFGTVGCILALAVAWGFVILLFSMPTP